MEKVEQVQEQRLLAKLERLVATGSSEMGFVAEELTRIYEREIGSSDMEKASPVDRARMLNILKKIGDVHRLVGNYSDMQKFYDRVLKADPDSILSASIHQLLGFREREAANWSRSTQHFNRVLEIGTAQKDLMWMAEGHHGLGYLLWRRGDFDGALKEYAMSIQLLNEAKKRPELATQIEEKRAIICVEEGNILGERGDFEEAYDSFTEALEVLKRLDNKNEMARVYNNLGHALVNMGRLDEAMKAFEQTVKFGQRLKDHKWLGWGNFNLAEVYGRKGDAAKAKALTEEGRKHLVKINDRVGYAKTYYTMGYAHMAAGEKEEAKKNFEEAVKKVEGCDMPALVAYYSYQYALALIHMGEKEPALRILKKSLHTYKLIKAEGYVLRIQKDIENLERS